MHPNICFLRLPRDHMNIPQIEYDNVSSIVRTLSLHDGTYHQTAHQTYSYQAAVEAPRSGGRDDRNRDSDTDHESRSRAGSAYRSVRAPEFPDTDVRFAHPGNEDGARVSDISRESRCKYLGPGSAVATKCRWVAMNLVGPCRNVLCTGERNDRDSVLAKSRGFMVLSPTTVTIPPAATTTYTATIS